MIIPTIDIRPLMAGEGPGYSYAAERVASDCHDTGFLVVMGHGIPQDLVARLRRLTIEFFAQSIWAKNDLRITKDNYRGYIPLGFFTPNASGKEADGYEGYKLHTEVDASDPIRGQCDLYGPNKWPNYPAELKRTVQAYWKHCDRVTAALLSVLLMKLNVDTDIVRSAFDYPLTNMTLLHYPGVKTGDSVVGIHPHKDTDVLTILAPDNVGSLEIRARASRQWMPLVAPPEALIINIGDMLELWSGGYYVSTPHRVMNSSRLDRYSFPYFSVPRHDIVVAPLGTPVEGFDRVSMDAGDVSRRIWQSNWPDSPPVESCYDPAIK